MTLFWPINFLCLQLKKNSALGVEVNPEAYSGTLSFKMKIIKFGDGMLINTLITTVESKPDETIIKFKHYIHNGLNIYQNK